MKRKLSTILALLLSLTMMISFTACGNKNADDLEDDEQTEVSEQTDGEESAEAENMPSIVKVIEEIDTEDEVLPLQIASVTLFDDGSVAVVPVDDLRKNEIEEEGVEMVYPFEESGPVKDVEVLYYGNGGYRTIVAVMEDGSISIVNGRALVEDHVLAVMDNVAGRDDFVEVKNSSDESAFYVVGVTSEDKEIVLDYSFNF